MQREVVFLIYYMRSWQSVNSGLTIKRNLRGPSRGFVVRKGGAGNVHAKNLL